MQMIDTRSPAQVPLAPAAQPVSIDGQVPPRQFDTIVASSMSTGLFQVDQGGGAGTLNSNDDGTRMQPGSPGSTGPRPERSYTNRSSGERTPVAIDLPGMFTAEAFGSPQAQQQGASPLLTTQDTTTTQRTQLDPNATTPPPPLPLPLVFTPEQLADMANRGAQGGDGTTPVGADGAPVPVSGVAGRAGA